MGHMPPMHWTLTDGSDRIEQHPIPLTTGHPIRSIHIHPSAAVPFAAFGLDRMHPIHRNLQPTSNPSTDLQRYSTTPNSNQSVQSIRHIRSVQPVQPVRRIQMRPIPSTSIQYHKEVPVPRTHHALRDSCLNFSPILVEEIHQLTLDSLSSSPRR